jgi:hypothetical protein
MPTIKYVPEILVRRVLAEVKKRCETTLGLEIGYLRVCVESNSYETNLTPIVVFFLIKKTLYTYRLGVTNILPFFVKSKVGFLGL